jgi:hypothetical protein
VEERLEARLIVYLVTIVVVAGGFELTADVYHFAAWSLTMMDLGSKIRCRQWLIVIVSPD